MKGFDTEALLLLPKFDVYDSRGGEHKSRLKVAVRNLINYLISQGIQPVGLYTDDTLHDISPEGMKYINPLSDADSFWASRHCEGMSGIMKAPKWKDLEAINKINKDAKDTINMTYNERCTLIAKHERKAAAIIITSFKIVIAFNYASDMQYKAPSKPNDGKIRILVDANNFCAEAFMSGNKVDIIDLLNIPYATRALYLWEVDDATSEKGKTIHSNVEL